mgnify:CR=1 FL=1
MEGGVNIRPAQFAQVENLERHRPRSRRGVVYAETAQQRSQPERTPLTLHQGPELLHFEGTAVHFKKECYWRRVRDSNPRYPCGYA